MIYIPYDCFFSGEREITHFCNYVIPFGVRGKKVVTIHDLAFREYPQTIRTRTMMMLKMNLRKTLKRADAIAVDSAFTKSELVKYYNVPKEKIYVVPCGIDKEKYEKKVMFALKDKEFRLAELGIDAGMYGAVRMVLVD